ncbi:cupin domain-containing protein [Bifidobacterium oedipodis]|uniref:Cupin domain-containing protein n=1 Tax=Bifidobacterium oedipodis TaxID=2675322 RepID=A0A7Y0EQ39_9BIFI|nr:cupin domain-containing protein [Bifidobacterium sp. DSM 109957]NMM94386.1 Cupin domain-containing protein [Bifidobacterium sp. DSM 109957]
MENPSSFPMGEPNTAFAQYFIGQSYLAPLIDAPEIGVHNVTFEPGCRNNWHIHHGSPQILMAVGGRGYYQFEGEEPHELKPGEAVYVPAGTKHWHGAAPTEAFAHIAIMLPGENVSTEWLEPVEDDVYLTLK